MKLNSQSILLQVLANISTNTKDYSIRLNDYHLKIKLISDDYLLNISQTGNNKDIHINNTISQAGKYDSDGAVFFVVATILFYALSIMVMIGANLSRTLADDDVKKFLKSYSALDIKKYEKIKVKTALNHKGIQYNGLLVNNTPQNTPDLGYICEESEEDDFEEEIQTYKQKLEYECKRQWKIKGFNLPAQEESFDYD